MQLPDSPLGKYSKASTLQRRIQLAYSFLFLGSHLKATRQRKLIRPEIEARARLLFTLPEVHALLRSSGVKPGTLGGWAPFSTSQAEELQFASTLKWNTICYVCAGILPVQSQRLNACSGYWTGRNRGLWIVPYEKRAAAAAGALGSLNSRLSVNMVFSSEVTSCRLSLCHKDTL